MNVFISHNQADKSCAEAVQRILWELGIPNFLSPYSMEWGVSIREKILEGVRQSTHLVLLLSDDALKSPWIPFESGCADALSRQILPFLIDNTLVGGEKWPPYLRRVFCQTDLEKVREHFIAEKKKPTFAHPTELHDPKLPVDKLRLTWQEVDRGIGILVECAKKFRPKYIFGIDRGGNIVGGMIAKQLGQHFVHTLDVDIDRPKDRQVIPYTCKIEGGDGILPLGEGLVCVESDPKTLDIQSGQARIMLVDDGYYSGTHMIAASEYLRRVHGNIVLHHAVLFELKHVDGREHGKSIIDCSAYYSYKYRVRFPWDPPSWDDSPSN